jgi:uncharacterized protein YaaR (DUF327 family)
MKVKSSDSNLVNTKSPMLNRSTGTSPRQSAFIDALKDSDTEHRNEACENILQQIDILSEELKKAPTPEGIKKYKGLISDFVKEALNQSYEIHEDLHWDRDGNRKNLVLVKQINRSVEELMDSVMNQEKKQIDLVARLDEIRGMLVDLYL